MLLIHNFIVITHFSLPTMKTSNHPMVSCCYGCYCMIAYKINAKLKIHNYLLLIRTGSFDNKQFLAPLIPL